MVRKYVKYMTLAWQQSLYHEIKEIRVTDAKQKLIEKSSFVKCNRENI